MAQYNTDNLADITDDTSEISAGQPASASSIQSYITDVNARIAALNDAVQALATTMAGASAPTNRAGAIFFDTANNLWMGDPDAAGYDQPIVSGLKYAVIDIGDWDMNATATVNIAHGLTVANIRSVQAVIRNDPATSFYVAGGSALPTGYDLAIATISTTVVQLTRETGGGFDNVSYDSTSFNRGWIMIWYVP